ncbi:hypothetical protein CPZ30_16590 [Paenibacillus lautus]|nr:hypothetical protein CPZ30_16590 [Paenibacillus lautus]
MCITGIELFIEPFIELLFMKLSSPLSPPPTMKKDAMRRTSGADESIPEKRSGRLKVFRRKTRIGRISCCRVSTLLSSFMKFGNNSDRRNDTYAERLT